MSLSPEVEVYQLGVLALKGRIRTFSPIRTIISAITKIMMQKTMLGWLFFENSLA